MHATRPRRFASAVFVLFVLSLVPLASPPAAAGEAPRFEAQLQEHLQQLDRTLVHRKLRLERQLAAGRVPEAGSSRKVAALRRHLSALEVAVRRQGPEDAEALLAKIHALRPRVDRLECGLRESTAWGPAGGFTLTVAEAGGLAGTVTDAETGAPVAGVILSVTDSSGFEVFGNGTSGADGAYEVGGLDPGTYFVYTIEPLGYLRQIYDGLPCIEFFNCNPGNGTPISVASGATTGGIDFALLRGGTISGTVTDSDTGSPLADVFVRFFDSGGEGIAETFTDFSGAYAEAGLYAGSHFVTVETPEYLSELYDDVPCPGGPDSGCDPSTGMPVEVSYGATSAGIDFALERLGAVSGTVTEAATGLPIPFLDVAVRDEEGRSFGGASTDASGFYFAGGLPGGTYFVVTESFSTFLDELYDDIPCPYSACDPSTGTPVAVSLNATTEDIDFALERLGGISGMVTEGGTGTPIPDLVVEIWEQGGNPVGLAFTNEAGRYTVVDLPPGTYFALASGLEHIGELYDDLPCADLSCDPTTGTPIPVNVGTITPDVDFVLERLGSISGRITDAVTGEGLAGMVVELRDAAGFFAGNYFPDDSGRYTINGLIPGDYFALARAIGVDYVDELYDDIPCETSCDTTAGTPIPVSSGMTTEGVDFALDRLGSISGRVTDATTGEPLPSTLVLVADESDQDLWSANTDSSGRYTVLGLGPGTYSARVRSANYVDELYDDIPCEGFTCDPTTGTPIQVSLNMTTEGVDFGLVPLGPCTPTNTSLCLNDHRFRVEVEWEDFDAGTGMGFARPFGGDSGTFWFFDPANVELVVKVLDACPLSGFNSFWVFAGGLTNLGAVLTVTDELTGEIKTYSNPVGSAFQPIRDTAAFDTCDAGSAGTAVAAGDAERLRGSALAEIDRRLADLGSREIAPLGPAGPAPEVELGVEGTCVPGPAALCLNRGRFLVEAVWETPNNGDSGVGRVDQLTPETGTFWFFAPSNIEVIVKVLDACSLSGFENYWVFAAGLTDVEVLLRVTDTGSGEIREYRNVQGSAFEPVQDTDHFRACP